MNTFKLTLNLVTADYTSEDHTSKYPSFQDALDEADDLAFNAVGFPLEDWEKVDFGDGNQLHLFYPNEADKTSRYKLTILEEGFEQ